MGHSSKVRDESSSIRIKRIIFLESYARILTYETLSYVNHIVAKQARQNVFTARCYASAVLAMGLCPSVSVCVCLSQAGVLLKRLNVGSHKQHHTIPQEL